MGKVFRFENLDDIEFKKDFLFSQNTTYGCGGGCLGAFYPKNVEEAAKVFKSLKLNGVKFTVLGKGSNVLASDKFFEGYVISTEKLKGVTLNGNLLCCLCGSTVGEILTFCEREGLGGLEFLYGIPATIGGIVYMNGGAAGKFIGEKVCSVSLFDGNLLNFSKNQCNFGYKHSTMRGINCLILSVTLNVFKSDGQTVKKNIRQYSNLRRRQPKGKSCGCVFKNPPEQSAGKLIDICGLKGRRLGGAEVSREHANFIINFGGRAMDVFRLIKEVQSEVYAKTGILLEEEVVYIGDFDET